MVKMAATAGSTFIKVPTTVTIEAASSIVFESSVISALPRAEGLVDAAVRVVGGLSRSKLLLHPRHPGAE